MRVSIQSVSFGDKEQVAETYRSKGKALTASAFAGAVIPVISNRIAGHSSFNALIALKGHNPRNAIECAIHDDLFSDKGKARNTVRANCLREVFKLAVPVTDQQAHDEAIEQAYLTIASYFAPLPKEQVERTNYKALAESLQSRINALEIDKAELAGANAELLTKLANSSAPATVPASVPATV